MGLAGEGSECFGLDDAISRDHDFGPGFCIWLPDEIIRDNRTRLEAAILTLPENFCGYPVRMTGPRVGAIGIRSFYKARTGLDHPPKDWQEWIAIPEIDLACSVNGEVFEDRTGEFSAWRAKLQGFYPEDVFLKKIASRVMIMAQAGQYNLPRCFKRGDNVAAMLACARFAEAAISFVYLVNRRFMPYYKLAPRLLMSLPVLGTELHETLNSLALQGQGEKETVVESFCRSCASYLYQHNLSSIEDDWLWAHGPIIAKRIENPAIRARNLLTD